jgi:anti-anti-sigma regulatory factor
MLRINDVPGAPGQRRLNLEGTISGIWVQELSALCEDSLRDGTKLVLDLAAVSFVDTKAGEMIRNLARRGVRIKSESPFVARQIWPAED